MQKSFGRIWISIDAWIIKESARITYEPGGSGRCYVRTWFIIPTINIRNIYYPMRYEETPYHIIAFYFLCYGCCISFMYIRNLRDLVCMKRWFSK